MSPHTGHPLRLALLRQEGPLSTSVRAGAGQKTAIRGVQAIRMVSRRPVERAARLILMRIYLRRTATLRDIATLLYVRNRALSSASTLHSFRLVHFDGRRGQCVAREVGTRITRLPARSLEKALDQALRGDHNEEDAGMDDVAPSLFQSIERECRPEVPREADEEAAGMTLENLDFRDGDILDCVFVEPMAKTHPSDWSSDHRSIPDIEVRHQHVHPRTDRPPRQNGRRLV